jgi:hypothetical protein
LDSASQIWKVQVNDSAKLGENCGQYMMMFQQIKLNCGYLQVETGTVHDDFWTVLVEIGTVRDADLTKSGENFGLYKVISSSFTR